MPQLCPYGDYRMALKTAILLLNESEDNPGRDWIVFRNTDNDAAVLALRLPRQRRVQVFVNMQLRSLATTMFLIPYHEM